MQIVIVQRSAHPNTLGWLRGLEARGHQVRHVVSLLTSKTPEDCSITLVGNVGWLSRLLTRLSGLSSQLKVEVLRPVALWKALARPRPDVVLLKTQGVSTLQTSAIALILRARRVAWTNQTWEQSRAWRALAWIGLMPRTLIHTTHESVGAITDVNSARSHTFLPYAVERASPTAQRAPAKGGVRVLTVTDYRNPRKRAWWVLEAAVRTGLVDGRATFKFVGHGPEDATGRRRILEVAAREGCQAVVDVRGPVPHSDMGELYRSHDLLVLPSVREPFGMVVLEAMAHGLAVLVSADAGARCCVVPGRNGLVFDPHSVDDLAACMKILISQPDGLGRMGNEGRRIAQEFASPEASADFIEQLATKPTRRWQTRRLP